MDVTRARSEALFTPKPTEARLRVGDTVEPSGQDVKPRLFDDCSLVSQPSTFVLVGVNASSIGYPSIVCAMQRTFLINCNLVWHAAHTEIGCGCRRWA